MPRLRCPPPVQARDRVQVVAPSSPFDRTLVLRGMGFLAQHYRVRFEPTLFARDGFLAGSDERRVAELNRALRDPDVRAIVAARGGYGLTRILERLDLAALRSDPKWIVGFSDITALHLECTRFGVASLHAHNVAGLGRGSASTRCEFVDALSRPVRLRRHTGLTTLVGGRASGTLVGGNLTLVASVAAAGRLRLPPDSLLVLEDVTEAPYRIDRALTGLLACGALDGVVGVVLGDFSDCPPGRHGVPVEAVLAERLATLRVPVAAGLGFGHGARNLPLHLGLDAQLDADAGVLEVRG